MHSLARNLGQCEVKWKSVSHWQRLNLFLLFFDYNNFSFCIIIWHIKYMAMLSRFFYMPLRACVPLVCCQCFGHLFD